jgi:formate hydrogenlyase subunit 6/NADH:ubiquinone oxidoreductase subunit I
MAYFSNGSESMAFEEQCGICKYGEKFCPIACIQMSYNYEAVKNELATKILNGLVTNTGKCTMFNAFKEDFEIGITEDKMIERKYASLFKKQNLQTPNNK